MAITYALAPIPRWIIIGNDGLTAGGAKLYTKSSLNKVQNKAVYADASGSVAWTNPIVFDANGTKGPFYWAVDSADADDLYYLEAHDSDNNVLWTQDNFGPASGSGGGGGGTSYLPLKNMIANPSFVDHIADTASPTNTTNLVIAPSNHHGFTPDLVNPVVGTHGVVGPDIRFIKNVTTATDQISFITFPLGDDPLTGDVTPVDYLRYQSNAVVGESYKCLQFPICQKVSSLDNQDVTFTIWASTGGTPSTLTLYTRQYFGSAGAASPDFRSSVGTLNVTSTWTKFNIQFTVPNTGGKTVGSCGDDALYLQLEFELGTACDVRLQLPRLYLGAVGSFEDFDTYDEIDAITQSPRTGDVKTSLRTSAQGGWVAMNDGSIGSASSGATTRFNIDTFFLYKTIWDGVLDAYAPVSTGRGATASADFNANKTLTLTRTLGRALAGSGAGSGLTARTLGQYLGEENHLLTTAELPSHMHPAGGGDFYEVGGGGTTANPGGGGSSAQNPNTGGAGGGQSHNTMQPTVFYNVYAKL